MIIFISLILFLTMNLYPQITDISRLPVQDSSQSYIESAPVVISENEILIFFFTKNYETDTLYSARSTDRGKTWQGKKFILGIKRSGDKPAYLTSIRTISDKILVAYSDWNIRRIGIIRSDNDGDTWSEPVYVKGGGTFPIIYQSLHDLNLSEIQDNRILLSFNTTGICFYRESYDFGNTWPDTAYNFNDGTNFLKNLSFVGLEGDNILSFFISGNENNTGIYKKVSNDGGQSWSSETKIIDSELNEKNPRVVKISNDELWLIYQVEHYTNDNLNTNDIYFIHSIDGGNSWDDPVRFTSYIGEDYYLNAARLNDKPFITFSSTRFTNNPQISFAILGETIENFRPPYVLNCQTYPDSTNQKTWIINCEIIDDHSVSVAFVDPVEGTSFELFDDGQHHDINPADNIFGNEIILENIPPSSIDLINVNKIKLTLNNKGIISPNNPRFTLNSKIKALDNEQQGISAYEVLTLNYIENPQYEEGSFLFSGGFILSGYTNGELWANAVASSILIEDYLPGKVGSNHNNPLNNVYVIRKEDPPFGYSWQQWKNAVSLGADFYDGDGDGIYNPVDKNFNGTWEKNEDMPLLIGDETAWCIYNDGLPAEMRRWGTVNPQGIEIKQTVFASDLPELENVVFIHYSILNTGVSTEKMDSVIFGIWGDPDLGDYTDDLVGCDTLLNSGIAYNREFDSVYGDNAPSFFTTVLQGPISYTGNLSDTAYNLSGEMYGSREFPESKNRNITAHIFIIGGDPLYNDPNDPVALRYYLTGKNAAGYYPDPCSFPNSEVRGGVNCNQVNPRFWMSGDPVSDYGWILTLQYDQKNIIASGPFQLIKDEPQEIIIAYVLGRGTDPINSITIARENVQRAIQEYKSNFASMTYSAPPPTNPVVSYILYQNYPNPFNPFTTIRYELPVDGTVTIEIFDILGQRVRTILNNFQKADRYEIKFDGSSLASGIYIYRMKVNDFITSKKMVLVK